MTFEKFQNDKGHWRIRVVGDGSSYMWGIPASEEFLIPEARRLHKRLGELIAECERSNAPR